MESSWFGAFFATMVISNSILIGVSLEMQAVQRESFGGAGHRRSSQLPSVLRFEIAGQWRSQWVKAVTALPSQLFGPIKHSHCADQKLKNIHQFSWFLARYSAFISPLSQLSHLGLETFSFLSCGACVGPMGHLDPVIDSSGSTSSPFRAWDSATSLLTLRCG